MTSEENKNKFSDLQPLFGTSAGGRLLIAGPCSAETRGQVLTTARRLKEAGADVFRAGIWKPRTHPGGFEGVGEVGLEWLREVRQETGMPVATEVATVEHAAKALEAGIDMLWIGARTSANPFAVQALAEYLGEQAREIPLLVKNPVNPDLELWIGALERFYNAGMRRLGAVHRGFSSYGEKVFRNAPQWQIPIELRLRFPSLPIFHDPSHTAGDASLVGGLIEKAFRLGFDGVMVESHCHPASAWSDASQQVTPEMLGTLMKERPRIALPDTDPLAESRAQIDEIDRELITLLGRRMEVSREIGELKRDRGMDVMQPERFNTLLDDRCRQGEPLGLSPDFIRRMMLTIHQESIRQQLPPNQEK